MQNSTTNLGGIQDEEDPFMVVNNYSDYTLGPGCMCICLFLRKKQISPQKNSDPIFCSRINGKTFQGFFGMTRNEVIKEIKEPSDEGNYNSFSVDEYGKAGLLYSRPSYSMLKLTGFSFRKFSPVLGNRVSESYARQAGWLIKECPSGKRYMKEK